jgi:hypothetical protein
VLLGIVGVLVAIPVAAAIRLLLQEVAFPGWTGAERGAQPSECCASRMKYKTAAPGSGEAYVVL